MTEPERSDPRPSDETKALSDLDSMNSEQDDINLEPTREGGSSSDSERKSSTDVKISMGRYELTQRLGQGGMGTVYRAWDSLLHRECALKIPKIPRNSQNTSQWLNRFYREAKIAAGFTHPNLCPIYDVAQFDGTHFLTMPVIPGESLARRLKRVKRVSPREAVTIVARLAEAMHFAHTAGVIHRDLKPDNVMLRPPDDDPVIMDFGLAVSDQPASPRLTVQGAFLGTLAYCSPEQLAGNLTEVGPCSDIFSLGVILYQLLTGQLPHAAKQRLLNKNQDGNLYVFPSEIQKGLPVALDGICLLALAKSPKNRFATMKDFANALSEVRENLEPRPSPIAPSKPPRRWRRLGFVAACLASSVLVFLGLHYRSTLPRPKPPTPVETPKASSVATLPNEQSPLSKRFVPNSKWVGDFLFRPDSNGKPSGRYGVLSLRVTSREGTDFRGIYRAENLFEWEVAGTVVDDVIQWTFVKAIVDAPHKLVVGYCECRVVGGEGMLSGVFVNKQMQMTADIHLSQEK